MPAPPLITSRVLTRPRKSVKFRLQCIQVVLLEDGSYNRTPHPIRPLLLEEELALPLVTHFRQLDQLHADCTCGSSTLLRRLRSMHTHSTKLDHVFFVLLQYSQRESSETVSLRVKVLGVYDRVCQILANCALTMSRSVTLRVLFQEIDRNPGPVVCDSKRRLLQSIAHLL
jgi:hypothetical protein